MRKLKMVDKYHSLNIIEKENVIKQLRAGLGQMTNIEFAFLHGSFTGEGPFGDIDLAIYFDPKLSSDERLEEVIASSSMLSHLVNISVDVHELNSAPLSFCYHASQGQIIFCRKREEVYDYQEDIWLKYADFHPFLKQNLFDLLEI